jgi:endonuclease YncB( thermonuclease family)
VIRPNRHAQKRRGQGRRVGLLFSAGLWLLLVALFYFQTADQSAGLAKRLGFREKQQSELVGVASVIDGATIEIHGRRIRLFVLN